MDYKTFTKSQYSLLQNVLILLGASCLISLIPIFIFGITVGHDPGYYYISYESFKHHVNGGEIYPRWLSDINAGYGGANFYFYQPFLFYLLYVLDALTLFTLSTNHILTLGITTCLFLSGLTFFIFAQKYTSPKPAVVLALIYMVIPYHLWWDLYERKALTEFAAYIWIPLIFYSIDKDMFKKPKNITCYGLAYAALIMTHLPSALITSFAILFYGLFQSIKQRTIPAVLLFNIRLGFLSLLGIGVAAIYLYPALTLLEHVNYAYLWTDFYDYKNHFLMPAGTYDGHSIYNGEISGMPGYLFTLATSQIVLCGLVFYTFYKKTDLQTNKDFMLFFGLALACFLMMNPISNIIWEGFPLLQRIQFTWRLMIMMDFITLALLCSVFSEKLQENPISKLVIVITAFILIFTSLISVVFISTLKGLPPQDAIDFRYAVKRLTEEHIPTNNGKGVALNDVFRNKPPEFLIVTSGQAKTSYEPYAARHFKIQVNARTPATIQVRQFMFPAWHLVKIENGKNSHIQLSAIEPHGLITFNIPAGKHSLELRLSYFKEEYHGFMISVFCLCALLLFGYSHKNTLNTQRSFKTN